MNRTIKNTSRNARKRMCNLCCGELVWDMDGMRCNDCPTPHQPRPSRH
jgi:hypothetical protein